MNNDYRVPMEHRLTLTGRETLTVSGVEDVERFDETGIVMATSAGAHQAQLIPGDALHLLAAAALVDAFLQGVVFLLLELHLLLQRSLLRLGLPDLGLHPPDLPAQHRQQRQDHHPDGEAGRQLPLFYGLCHACSLPCGGPCGKMRRFSLL